MNKNSSQRKYQILKKLIEEFIESAKPVSSGCFQNFSEFDISSATIRNEMNQLEKEGLLMQPHTSAGRIPTSKGYSLFIESLMEYKNTDEKEIIQEFEKAKKAYFLKKAKEKVYDGVAILSKLTENIAFATIPENKQTFFLGIANLLKQPEFCNNNQEASLVIEILEDNFFEVLNGLEIKNEVEIHIGESDMLKNISSCSLLCCKYFHLGFEGVLGIVGPMRMDYPRNKTLIEYTKMFIEGQKLLS
jgi:heat-inducible transcriptional repressor